MSGRLVFAKGSGVLTDASGLPWRTIAGQAWDAGDPLVVLHPEAFAAEPLPEHVGHTRLGEGLPEWLRVEQATRNPGEARRR